MAWFSNLFGRSKPAPASTDVPEHALLVYLELSDPDFGTEAERESIHALTDELDEAIASAGVGEFDGDEFGDGTCTLYMYGPDADRLFATVEPILTRSPLTAGGHAVKRYGSAGDPSAREERIRFGD
jgi:hypothetical protein